MKTLISCAYNMDNCCVELKFNDGSNTDSDVDIDIDTDTSMGETDDEVTVG